MQVPRIFLTLMIASFLLSGHCVMIAFADVSKTDAASALTAAEGTVRFAYQAVFDAEQTGANVTDLLGQLNKAGENLSLAHVAYVQGDYRKATDFAYSSEHLGDEVHVAAVDLKNSTLSESVRHIWLTIIGSAIGVVIASLGSFWIWHFLGKRYRH